MNIDGNGGLDVINDTDRRTENAEEYESDGDNNYEEENEHEHVPQVSYAKSVRPPMLETIRSYSADKQPPIPGKKTSEHDI